METFDSIYERMSLAYYDAAGIEPAAVSDSALRLRTLAAELLRLHVKLDFIRRAAFPQTAQGEALSAHGEMRGIGRMPASFARGEITFSRYLPLETDLSIPAGTVCAIPGDAPQEYETTEDATLKAGELNVTAPAKAVKGGRAGNCSPGVINALVSAPEGISYCSNASAFSGGEDAEDDESLRERIFETFREPVLNNTERFYKDLALSFPGVKSAQAVLSEGGVNLYVWGEGAPPGEEVLSSLQKRIDEEKLIGAKVTVQAAQGKTLNPGLRISAGDFSAASDRIKSAISKLFSEKSVGDGVLLTEISAAALNAAALEKLEFSSSTRDLPQTAGAIPVLGEVSLEDIS